MKNVLSIIRRGFKLATPEAVQNSVKTVLNGTVNHIVAPNQSKRIFNLITELRGFQLYQPLPWLGFSEGTRATETKLRWKVIRDEIPDESSPGTAMDLGAQIGYFSFKLAERGWLCLAVEADEPTYHASIIAKNAIGLSNVAHRNLLLGSDSVRELPRVDVTIFLSLWHHIVHSEGFNSGKEVLSSVLDKTNKVCFFETGQTTEKGSRELAWLDSLPSMEPSPDVWIKELLLECGARDVKNIGKFGTPHLNGEKRTLFAAIM